MLSINCVTCDHERFKNFYSKIDSNNGKNIAAVICTFCGTIQVRPRPDEKETLAYYSKETYREEKGVNDDAVHQKLLRRGERILAKLTQCNRPTANVLEIGCGIGSILKPFQDKGSCVVGYELNAKEVKYGKSKNIDVRVGTINDLDATKKYDVIIYSHVIEHLVYPLNELEKVRNLLLDKGTLVVLLPGFYNMRVHKYKMKNYIVYPHLQYFTLKTLTSMLGQAKFKRIYGEEEIFAIFVKSENSGRIHSDYKKTILQKSLYRLYLPFYTPIFRVRRKIKKLLKKS